MVSVVPQLTHRRRSLCGWRDPPLSYGYRICQAIGPDVELCDELSGCFSRFLRPLKGDQVFGCIQLVDDLTELFAETSTGRVAAFESILSPAAQPEGLRCLAHKPAIYVPPLLATPVLLLVPPLILPSQSGGPQGADDADQPPECCTYETCYALIHGSSKAEPERPVG